MIAGVTTAFSPIASPAKTPATASAAMSKARPTTGPGAGRLSPRQDLADELEEKQEKEAEDHSAFVTASAQQGQCQPSALHPERSAAARWIPACAAMAHQAHVRAMIDLRKATWRAKAALPFALAFMVVRGRFATTALVTST